MHIDDIRNPNSVAQRLWSRAQRGSHGQCWEWQGARINKHHGYGVMGLIHRGKPRQVYVHRLAYVLTHGFIPSGLCVCHSCDNPGCVNPDHLFVGTMQDNVDDMRRKGRARQGVTRGSAHWCSKLTEEVVATIRQRYAAGTTTTVLSQEFGLDRSQIVRAITGRSWSHVTDTPPQDIPRANQKLTEDAVQDIRARYAAGESGPSLASAYNVSPTLIYKIAAGKMWTHLPLVPATQRGGRRNAKLTPEQVQLLRARHAEGVECSQLAKEFHLAAHTCWDIITRRTWKDLP